MDLPLISRGNIYFCDRQSYWQQKGKKDTDCSPGVIVQTITLLFVKAFCKCQLILTKDSQDEWGLGSYFDIHSFLFLVLGDLQ